MGKNATAMSAKFYKTRLVGNGVHDDTAAMQERINNPGLREPPQGEDRRWYRALRAADPDAYQVVIDGIDEILSVIFKESDLTKKPNEPPPGDEP